MAISLNPGTNTAYAARCSHIVGGKLTLLVSKQGQYGQHLDILILIAYAILTHHTRYDRESEAQLVIKHGEYGHILMVLILRARASTYEHSALFVVKQ